MPHNKSISTADILGQYRRATGTGPNVSSIIARLNQNLRAAERKSAQTRRHVVSAGKTGFKIDKTLRDFNTAKLAKGDLQFFDFLKNPNLYRESINTGAKLALESGQQPAGLGSAIFKGTKKLDTVVTSGAEKTRSVIGETANKAIGGISEAVKSASGAAKDVLGGPVSKTLFDIGTKEAFGPIIKGVKSLPGLGSTLFKNAPIIGGALDANQILKGNANIGNVAGTAAIGAQLAGLSNPATAIPAVISLIAKLFKI